MTSKKEPDNMDYARLLPRTLWAIRPANVRYGV